MNSKNYKVVCDTWYIIKGHGRERETWRHTIQQIIYASDRNKIIISYTFMHETWWNLCIYLLLVYYRRNICDTQQISLTKNNLLTTHWFYPVSQIYLIPFLSILNPLTPKLLNLQLGTRSVSYTHLTLPTNREV